MDIGNWSLLLPFLVKSTLTAIGIGIFGLIIGRFFCYTEPEDSK